jgi:hypothetical protein
MKYCQGDSFPAKARWQAKLYFYQESCRLDFLLLAVKVSLIVTIGLKLSAPRKRYRTEAYWFVVFVVGPMDPTPNKSNGLKLAAGVPKHGN